MNENKGNNNKSKICWKKIINLILFLILVLMTNILIGLIDKQLKYEEKVRNDIEKVKKEEEELNIKLIGCNKSLEVSLEHYVEEVGLKPCVMLCFDNFEDSAYREIIDKMDKYNFKGTIIFRDGNCPGSDGAISVELYKELLEKGWQGAIGNSERIRVYSNMPDICKEKWTDYIVDMQKKFEENGLEIPEVYVPHKNEIVLDIFPILEEYNLTMYTNLCDDLEEAKTRYNDLVPSEMGMIIGKFDYKNMHKDLTNLIPKAESVAIVFQKVENGAPKNKKHTSTYMLGKQLERLSMLDEYINVTTFSGYRQYQQNIIAHNELVYKNYLMEQNAIRNQIALLQSQIAEKYADVFEKK